METPRSGRLLSVHRCLGMLPQGLYPEAHPDQGCQGRDTWTATFIAFTAMDPQFSQSDLVTLIYDTFESLPLVPVLSPWDSAHTLETSKLPE